VEEDAPVEEEDAPVEEEVALVEDVAVEDGAGTAKSYVARNSGWSHNLICSCGYSSSNIFCSVSRGKRGKDPEDIRYTRSE
jgi:CDGSH-type Zn-finger protein